MTGFALEGVGLSRRYGGFLALDNVSIALTPGEIRGLIGPNGAGKSTLMDALCGRGGGTTSGVVRFQGRDISHEPARARRRSGLARSFQKTNIFADMKVAEQVGLAARAAEQDNTSEVLEALGLAALADRRAADISYGDQRRLDLALALVGRPSVLLLDEPAAGLSIAESLVLAKLLKELASSWHVTVLIVEHDMDVIFSVSDRITVLHLGKVLADGPGEEIRANQEVVRAYLGDQHRMNLLQLDNVDAFYGEAQVLHGISIRVDKGERVAILGRNGVGKTTVVNACTGVARVKSGTIAFNGKPVSNIRHFTAARSGIAFVPQGRRIVPGLTVRENLLLGAAVGRKGPWNFDTVCELFPILKERSEGLGTAMSGGQQQMLAIGRALMANPALLVLDEPSEGLAPVIVDELGATLVRLAQGDTSILLIEQNFSLVHNVAERYYVMSKGSVVEDGKLAGLSKESLKKHVAV